MATNQVAIGSGGVWQIDVDLVSQNAAANTSVVRVRGTLLNTTSVRSFNNNNIAKSVSGTNSWSSSTGGFDVPAHGQQTVIDVQFTITHDAGGYAGVNYGVGIGATGTGTFGGGGSVATSLVLPRIPKVPGKMATPTRAFIAPTTVRVSFNNPTDNGGVALTSFQMQYANNVAFTGATLISGILSTPKDVTGLAIGNTWYFRMRAVNSVGPGPWSDPISYAIPNVPSAPAVPTLTYTPPTTMKVDYAAPSSDGGAAITKYDIRYSDTADFSGTVYQVLDISGLTATVTNLVVGKPWYFQVRAKNSQGPSAWSSSAIYLVVCGPRIRVSSIWKNTVAYVRVGGVWKVAIPYVKVAGTWKVAGG